MDNQEGNLERGELLQKLMEAVKSPVNVLSNEEIRKILSLTQMANVSKENKNLQATTSENSEDSSTDDDTDAIQEQPATSTSFSGMENYPRRPGSDDMGREYEIKITALFSIRCATMKDTKDMWLGSNVDKVGDFDDIVLFKQTSADEHFAYMLQLKHQENPKNVTHHDLMRSAKTETGKREKSKNDFSLSKYSKGFVELMSLINDSEENEWEIFRYLRRVKRIIFVLYTNKGVNDCEFLENVGDDMLINMFHTNRCTNKVYKFIHHKLNYDSEFLQQLILFTNQAHLHETDKLIKNEIKRFLTSAGVTDVDFKKVTNKFVTYIRTWAKGFEDHKNSKIFYSLTKSDIFNKLIDLVLDPYKLDFSKEHCLYSNIPETMFWNKLIDDKTITVVDYDEPTSEFLKSCIKNELKQYCSELKRTWFDHLSKNAQNLFCKDFPNFNTRIIIDREEITLFDIYQILWFNNKVPLLLKIDKVQDYQKIDKILRLSDNNFRTIITKNKSLELAKIKNSKHFFALNNLNQEQITQILNQPVRLQGRSSEILNNLVDKSMYKNVKCKDIINILQNEFSVGNEFKTNNVFIQRSLSKVFLERNVLTKTKNELFLIEDFNLTEEEYNNVITSIDQIKKSEKRPVHHLVSYNEHFYEWVESIGSINNIRKFQQQQLYKMQYVRNDKINYSFNIVNLWVPLEEKISKINFWNNTTILSANPGTGKSILMDLIACQAPLDVWVLKINLNEHEDYYKKMTNCKAREYLENFFEEILKFQDFENKDLARTVFKKFLDKKKILILLDGFDEISIAYADEVTKIAKSLHDEGYQMWITTRSVMKMHLEHTFNTFSIGLKQFTPSDQGEYLRRYFTAISDGNRNEILEKFVTELLQAAKVNLFDYDWKFTGIPLQTQLLAEVFTKEYNNCLKTGVVIINKKFDLLYLYKEFLRRKIDILCDKFGKDAERTRVLFEEHQEMFSLKTVFKREYLSELNIEDKLDAYCQNKKHEKEMQFLQREGVVVLDQTSSEAKYKFNVNFVHQTFAEYLAAKWLAENFNNEDEIIKRTVKFLVGCRFKLFDCSRFIFMIFDRLLVKDCKSHLALINGRLEEIDLSDVNTKDKGGRTLLQLMALNGYNHPGSYYKPMSKVEDKIAKLIENIPPNKITDTKDTILQYNVLDYALASDSLAVANIICEKASDFLLNIDISVVKKHRYFTYCVVLEYQALFKILVPYFAARDMLIWKKPKNIIIESYCRLQEEQYKTQKFYDYVDAFGVETISELFKFKYKDPKSLFANCYFDLRFATVFGAISNIHLLISQGLDLNQQDVDLNTPLHYAAERGRLETVKIFLSEGADVNIQGKDGNTALHIAAKIGNNEMVEELLIKGAEINKFNNINNTPIHFALMNGHLDTVNLLLLNGASSTVESKNGETVLHFAAAQGSDDTIIEILVRHPEVLNKQNNSGSTPLHKATRYEQFNAVRLLLSNGADCNVQDASGNSALHYAVTSDDDYIINELLNNSVIDLQNNEGKTALHLAASKDLDTTKLLLSRGANCNIKDQRGYSPLHHAIVKGHIDIVSELLNAGADVNSIDSAKSTPLHVSTMSYHTDISILLLSSGAEANVKDINNLTPLHYASLAGCVKTISELLAKDANINALSLYKYTPLHDALSYGRVEAAKLLLSKGANSKTESVDGKTPLHAAAANGCTDLVAQFLTDGFDANKQTQDGDTSLHLAASRGYPNTVKLLLDNSASVNMQNAFGKTPLHISVTEVFYYDIAIYERQKSTVRLLLDKEAHVNKTDEDGNTALHYACRTRSDIMPSHIENMLNYFYNDVVAMLLDSGANCNLKNEEGLTPLDIADKNGYESLHKILKRSLTIEPAVMPSSQK